MKPRACFSFNFLHNAAQPKGGLAFHRFDQINFNRPTNRPKRTKPTRLLLTHFSPHTPFGLARTRILLFLQRNVWNNSSLVKSFWHAADAWLYLAASVFCFTRPFCSHMLCQVIPGHNAEFLEMLETEIRLKKTEVLMLQPR